MATADRYSRIVLWLKVTLPLLALAILSTLFFVAETLDPEAAIPYADVDVAKILREQGVTQPTFGGVNSDGVSISLFAESVRPSPEREGQLIGRAMVANLEFPSGSQVTIESETGVIDAKSETATLKGSARLESSLGYLIQTNELITSVADASVVAPGAVEAEGPPGKLNAGHMELTRTEGDPPGYLLVFKNGVKLVYTPQP